MGEHDEAIERVRLEARRYGPRWRDPEVLDDVREQLTKGSIRWTGQNPAISENSANDAGDGPETDTRF